MSLAGTTGQHSCIRMELLQSNVLFITILLISISEENESSLVGQLVRHEEPVRGLEFSTIAPNPTIKGKIVVKEGNNGCGSCHSQRNNLDLAKHLIIPSLNSF
ncbi:LSD1 zinc finger family protein [Trifolium repens]|nr:LSD1 zinc finger family protein [Trifolium repens]